MTPTPYPGGPDPWNLCNPVVQLFATTEQVVF